MHTIPSDTFGHWYKKGDGTSQYESYDQFFDYMMSQYPMLSKDTAQNTWDRLKSAETFYTQCNTYKVVRQTLDMTYDAQVIHDGAFDGTVWLSIRKHPADATGQNYLCDWREFQAIKNDLVSKDRVAIEIYPEEYRVNDTDNVFHLWVLPEHIHIPLGWLSKDISETALSQRPFSKSK